MKNILLVSILLFSIPFIAKAAVIINEIAWMGIIGNQYGEWLELYNTGTEEIDLNNWKLYKDGGDVLIFTLTKKIASGGYLAIERTTDSSPDSLPEINDESGKFGGGSLINLPKGEYLVLKNAEDSVIEDLDFSNGWPAGDNVTKQTMERITNGWQTSLNPGGTPKSQNSSGEESEEEPEESEEPTEEPEVPPTPPSGGTSNQLPIADAGNDIIAFIGEEITFNGSKSYDPDGSELAYEWNLGEGGVKNEAVITHQYSYPGTYLVTLMVYDGFYYSKNTITVEIYPKKITINEFLPSPVGKDAGDEEDPGEWIELYNDSDQIVNISSWQLDDEDGGSKPFTFPENTLIVPKGFLIFSRQTTGIALNNDSDKVRLLLSTGIVFQEISYEKAKEGLSSALTPQGFIWSTPTPGLPNIVITEERVPEYEGSLHSETTSQLSGNVVLNYDSRDSTEGGWTIEQRHHNLADLEESSGGNNKIVLIILTIAVIIFTVVIGITKLKKRA